MSKKLFHIGQTAFRRHRLVAAAWLVVLIVAIAAASTFGGKINNEFTVPDTESQDATDLLKETFPEASGASAQIVFVAPPGRNLNDPALRPVVEAVVNFASGAPQVAGVIDPYTATTVTPDGRTALAPVQYREVAGEIDASSIEALQLTREPAAGSGITVEFGGEAFQAEPAVGVVEAVGVLLAFAILAVALGSVFAAGLPLLTALIGLGVSMAVVFAFSDIVKLSSAAPLLAVMIGLAVGIDYALFIISRYRNELARGLARDEAAGRAVGTAGGAVVFAGITVFVALAALAVVRVPFLTVMGAAAAATVVSAVLVAITLLPAILGFAGSWVTPKAAPLAQTNRWLRIVTRKPLVTVLAVVVLLGVLAIPARDLYLALPDNGGAPSGSTQRKAFDFIEDGFGPGYNGPLFVVVDNREASSTAASESAVQRISDDLRRIDGVVAVPPAQPSINGQVSLIQAVPAFGPDDSRTKPIVQRVRDAEAGWQESTGATVMVTGYTAAGIDVSSRLTDTVIPFALIVVGLAFLVLLLVFRSILIPIKAALGFLLSVAAAFGLTVAVFQWGWLADLFAVEPMDATANFLPVILLAVLFGLAMDYEVFLVSRMREAHSHGSNFAEAVSTGFAMSARVVTAAALIMFSVFASFITNEDPGIKAIAFALAVGILIDAFFIRMTLVPAALMLMKERAWWFPARLDKVLPKLDIEGARLVESPVGSAVITETTSGAAGDAEPSVEPVAVPSFVIAERRALRRALRDLEVDMRDVHVRCTTVAGEVLVELSGDLTITLQHGKSDTEEELAWRFADRVQQHLLQSKRSVPGCPQHEHNPLAVLAAGNAHWTCPQQDDWLDAPVGQLVVDLRESADRSMPG